jgi:hypothetical protein
MHDQSANHRGLVGQDDGAIDGVWPLLIVGLSYSLWRILSRKKVCGACGSMNMVPLKSPVGRKIAEASKAGTEPA